MPVLGAEHQSPGGPRGGRHTRACVRDGCGRFGAGGAVGRAGGARGWLSGWSGQAGSAASRGGWGQATGCGCKAERDGAGQSRMRPPAECLALLATRHAGWAPCRCRFLTGSIEEFSHKTGISQAFVGMIILPIAGNACEHITGARRGAAPRTRRKPRRGLLYSTACSAAQAALPGMWLHLWQPPFMRPRVLC
jgi:hypothetical protein